jgi:hypothetical protein
VSDSNRQAELSELLTIGSASLDISDLRLSRF